MLAADDADRKLPRICFRAGRKRQRQERVLIVLAQYDHRSSKVLFLAVDLVANVDAEVNPPDLTLAEIGKAMNEHEATVSRKLERVRQELKDKVIAILKSGGAAKNGPHAQPGHGTQLGANAQPSLDDAQIQLCFEYATEAWPFDFSPLLDAIPPQPGISKSPPPDG